MAHPAMATTEGAPSLRVGFQGELGAYSHEAIERIWGLDAEPVGHREAGDALDALLAGAVDAVVLPVENSIAGMVTTSHDALSARQGLHVTGESLVPIHHCLLGLPGSAPAMILTARSHPVALAQCGAFFRRHPQLRSVPDYDTAGAARTVASLGDPTVAAVASRGAAARYGLQVLAENIEDRPDNATRFWVLARQPTPLPAGTAARTALMLPVPDAPHALLGLLRPLVTSRVDLRRIGTRPAGAPGRHHVLLEIAHCAGDPALANVLARLQNAGHRPRVLGTFAAAGGPPQDAEPSDPGRDDAEHPAPAGAMVEHPASGGAPRVRAIRGATTVETDEPTLIRSATRTLLTALLRQNGIDAGQVISAIFTATGDLTSEFPAHGARELGWTDVPLLCSTEIPVPGALPRCIRVLLHVELRDQAPPVRHVYLNEARALRPDLQRS